VELVDQAVGQQVVPEAFEVVGVESLVHRHDHDIPAGDVAVAVERHDVADNELAHGVRPPFGY
jgi:hypothetical protein